MADRPTENSTLYDALELPEDASDSDIKRAYRRLARDLHPDVTGGDPDSTERFRRVADAHAVLSDPVRRADYDRRLRSPSVVWDDMFAGADLNDLLTKMFADTERFTAPTASRRREPIAQVTVSFRESLDGCQVPLWLAMTRSCPTCDGAGCPDCQGTGREHRPITVRLPPGVRDGERVRIQHSAANLFLRVDVTADPVFTRVEDDLHMTAVVPFPMLVLGGTVTVDGPYGEPMPVRVPAGTKDGGTVLAPGGGARRGHARGNLLVTVHAEVPHEVTAGQRAALEEFSDLMGYPTPGLPPSGR